MKANYLTHSGGAVEGVPLGSLILTDIGPWDKFATITNAAEETIQELKESGQLREGRRVFYVDSEGEFDEILIKDGKFAGFKVGGGSRRPT